MTAILKNDAIKVTRQPLIQGLGTATLEYQDRMFQRQSIKILPGEYFATPDDVMLVTLLGSCVAACVRDPERRVGGMNHFLLPHSSPKDPSMAARYGSYAMELLINDLLKLGARRDRLVAKVFGGANVVKVMTKSRVGQQNADFVLQFLEQEDIPVLASDLGGLRPRRIHFFPHTGQVMVRLLPEAEAVRISREEIDLEEKAEHTHGDVELFS